MSGEKCFICSYPIVKDDIVPVCDVCGIPEPTKSAAVKIAEAAKAQAAADQARKEARQNTDPIFLDSAFHCRMLPGAEFLDQ